PSSAPLRCLGTSCTDVLRHPSRSSLALVVAARVERQLADEVAGLIQHPDVQVVDQDQDASSGVAPTEPDVVQLAVVAQGDDAAGVHPVLADAPVAVMDADAGRLGLGSSPEGLGWRAPVQGPVRSAVL